MLILQCTGAVITDMHPKHFIPGRDAISLDLLLALMASVVNLIRHNEMLRKPIHATDLYKEAKLLICHNKRYYQVH